jgi:transposase-like protein
MDALSQPISPPRTKRRYRSVEERRRIVEETLVPGTSVAIVARAHGVNANQVFGWRKLYHSGLARECELNLRQRSQHEQRPVIAGERLCGYGMPISADCGGRQGTKRGRS